jgi:ribose transport system permease protein
MTQPRFDMSHWVRRNRWIWSAASVLFLWLALSAMTSRFSLQSLSGVAVSGSFLALVALGQMFVVTTGRGNIDLSIGSVMTLSAYVALIVIAGQDSWLLPGLVGMLAIGLAVGAINALLVIACRIPAIIATLGTGYVLATTTLLANRSIKGFAISPTVHVVATGRVAGIPIMVVVATLAAMIASFVVNRTAYGHMLSAVGQNERAARLAGVRAGRVIAAAFITSSLLAAFCGLLLGAYVGGAFLDMGQPFLLQSLGAVVLGGTLIFGGQATALGTVSGSFLLILIVTIMQIAGLPAGAQEILQGVVVISVLALAGGTAMRRRSGKTLRPQPQAQR